MTDQAKPINQATLPELIKAALERFPANVVQRELELQYDAQATARQRQIDEKNKRMQDRR